VNTIIELNDLATQTVTDFEDPEAAVRSQLDTLHKLSQKFLESTSEKSIIFTLLKTSIDYTNAIGASFIPFDDQGYPYAIVSKSEVFDNVDLDSWAEYFSAPSIASQCKMCRKDRPVTKVCPLLNSPFSGEVALFCIHLKTSNQRFGVLNLYLRPKLVLSHGTEAFLTTITNSVSLVISLIRERGQKGSIDHNHDGNQPDEVKLSQVIAETKQLAIVQERSRLAREIHDGLAQILGYVKLQLSQSIDYLKDEESKGLIDLIENSYQAISDAYIDAREAIDDLHNNPYPIDFVFWLEETLDNYQDNFHIQTKLIGWPEYLILPSYIHVHLTRMFQELLSNIRKHANANLVTIRYKNQEGVTSLEIRDNGIGIPDQDALKPKGHGIQSLKERAEIINAELEINGQMGQGTSVLITLPYKQPK
jgi:signal transduction histidine kinase